METYRQKQGETGGLHTRCAPLKNPLKWGNFLREVLFGNLKRLVELPKLISLNFNTYQPFYFFSPA